MQGRHENDADEGREREVEPRRLSRDSKEEEPSAELEVQGATPASTYELIHANKFADALAGIMVETERELVGALVGARQRGSCVAPREVPEGTKWQTVENQMAREAKRRSYFELDE